MDGTDHGVDDATLLDWSMVFRPDLMADRTALVSGAGSGLGKATAVLLARLGARLVVCGRDVSKLDALVDLLAGIRADVRAESMTIRDPEAVERLMDVAFERGLDLLVNNAGGQFPQAAIDFSAKGWNAVIDTNLNGTWYMMQAAARRWRERGEPGSIVNVVAVTARGLPGIAHTAAARAGVEGLTRTVAVEWAPDRIRVNCVAPGCVETTAFGLYPEAAARTFAREANPMRRAGEARDVAEAVIYLGADAGRFVTGETLHVDGGQRLWGDPWAIERPAWFSQDG